MLCYFLVSYCLIFCVPIRLSLGNCFFDFDQRRRIDSPYRLFNIFIVLVKVTLMTDTSEKVLRLQHNFVSSSGTRFIIIVFNCRLAHVRVSLTLAEGPFGHPPLLVSVDEAFSVEIQALINKFSEIIDHGWPQFTPHQLGQEFRAANPENIYQ